MNEDPANWLRQRSSPPVGVGGRFRGKEGGSRRELRFRVEDSPGETGRAKPVENGAGGGGPGAGPAGGGAQAATGGPAG